MSGPPRERPPITGAALKAELERIDNAGRTFPPFVMHTPSPVAALCPACLGRRRVPVSITQDSESAERWRDCNCCLALVDGRLRPCGMVHIRKVLSSDSN